VFATSPLHTGKYGSSIRPDCQLSDRSVPTSAIPSASFLLLGSPDSLISHPQNAAKGQPDSKNCHVRTGPGSGSTNTWTPFKKVRRLASSRRLSKLSPALGVELRKVTREVADQKGEWLRCAIGSSLDCWSVISSERITSGTPNDSTHPVATPSAANQAVLRIR